MTCGEAISIGLGAVSILAGLFSAYMLGRTHGREAYDDAGDYHAVTDDDEAGR